jgi:hypothetical protein
VYLSVIWNDWKGAETQLPLLKIMVSPVRLWVPPLLKKPLLAGRVLQVECREQEEAPAHRRGLLATVDFN